jgi:hypothetical protein
MEFVIISCIPATNLKVRFELVFVVACLERNSQIYQHNTRGKNKVHTRTCRTALVQNNVLNNAIRLYNKLPERIRVFENFRSFKKEVKSLLIANTLYSVDEFLNSSF